MPSKKTGGFIPNPLFSKAVIRSRYRDLFYQCTSFKESWNVSEPIKHDFDGSILYAITVCAMHDIARYKIYHLQDPALEKLDAIKRAAFYTKWITRLHPFYAVRRGTIVKKYDDHDKIFFANESFALSFALNQLRADDRVKVNYRISPELWAALLYDMKYRVLSEDAYIETYQMIFDDSLGQRPTLQ